MTYIVAIEHIYRSGFYTPQFAFVFYERCFACSFRGLAVYSYVLFLSLGLTTGICDARSTFRYEVCVLYSGLIPTTWRFVSNFSDYVVQEEAAFRHVLFVMAAIPSYSTVWPIAVQGTSRQTSSVSIHFMAPLPSFEKHSVGVIG